MKTATRGNVGESAVLNGLTKIGMDVLVPFGSGQPFDLVVHLGQSAFLRVQCKTAWEERGCLVFNCLSTDHGRGPQPYTGLADIFGVYLPTRDSVYLVPIDAIAPSKGRLRLDAARNNQQKRTRMASEFELACWNANRLIELVRGGGDRARVLPA